MANPSGYIIDKGFSPIDGKPYVAILTLSSNNRKTGNMAQVWILRDDISPVEALITGGDYSICGNCPHRRQANGKRSCYVNVGQAPNSIWKAYKRGVYKSLDYVGCQNLPMNGLFYSQIESILKGRRIRWGAYGDPSIINSQVVNLFNSYADGHTGYTHQWRNEFASAYKGVFQASCDSFMDYMDASTDGWKCFLVVDKRGKSLAPSQAKICPATIDNSQAQCMTCKLCDGAKTDIFVEAHGSGAKYVAYA
jgi:hypothetical protein